MPGEVSILVVDDRREDLTAIEAVLASSAYRVITALSATEALRHLLDHDFAVILLDVHMPVVDGFALAEIIKQRERSRHTSILFLTASGTDVTTIYRAYSAGGVDYLSKPIDADVLRAKIAIFVELFVKDQRIQEQAEALRQADRREREHELAELRRTNERRYRNLAEAIPQIVWTTDARDTITYVNQRWFEYTGQPAVVPDEGWTEAMHPADRARWAVRWQHALGNGQVVELELRLRGADGGYRWHLCRAVPERGPDDAVVGWLGTYTDFDDRRRALDAAEAAVHARDEFLSIASHELRTPLTTLQLRLRSLEHVFPEAPDDEVAAVRYRLDSALRQCDRLGNLVENLLDVARITNGRLTLHRESFPLADAVEAVLDRSTELAARAGCDLELRVDASVVGQWDRLRVEQVMQNLLDNAIKYAPRAPIEIVVGAQPNGASIAVRDHGIGISSEVAERIFGQFERAVSARHYGGLGMGLFIARQIVEAHGGSIRVGEAAGDGATFVVELPVTPPHASA